MPEKILERSNNDRKDKKVLENELIYMRERERERERKSLRERKKERVWYDLLGKTNIFILKKLYTYIHTYILKWLSEVNLSFPGFLGIFLPKQHLLFCLKEPKAGFIALHLRRPRRGIPVGTSILGTRLFRFVFLPHNKMTLCLFWLGKKSEEYVHTDDLNEAEKFSSHSSKQVDLLGHVVPLICYGSVIIYGRVNSGN